MKKLKVMSIFGTRPEAIKMAPLIKAIENNENLESLICVTAQHREMLDQVLEIFNLKPDYDLDIMRERQTLEGITTKVIMGLTEVLNEAKPDIILVHGDTTTTFAASLAGFYNKITVGHVEAGLRTFNKYEPFPEEINRRLTGVISDLHFSPTPLSKQNLLNENVSDKNIFITGNTVIDALKTTIHSDYKFTIDVLNEIDFKGKKVIAMTAHRRENLGQPLRNICNAVKRIVDEFEDVEVVYAVHKNPAVVEVVEEILGGNERIHLTDPLNLEDMHNLMNNSYLVLTDSGGLQEEVPSMGKPVLVLRNVTERPEGIKAGTLKLAGIEENTIYKMTKELLTNQVSYSKMAKAKNPFGDGDASKRIIEAILYHFNITKERPKDFFAENKKEDLTMKDERMTILSMVEKGIISVEEAEKLILAINQNNGSELKGAVDGIVGGLTSIAKKIGIKAEQVIDDTKPVVKKAIDDTKPIIKKASDKIDQIVEDSKPVVEKAVSTVKEKANEFTKPKTDEFANDTDFVYDEAEFENAVVEPVTDENTVVEEIVLDKEECTTECQPTEEVESEVVEVIETAEETSEKTEEAPIKLDEKA